MPHPRPGKHCVSVKSGVIVDASVAGTPHKPKGSRNIEVADDREDNRIRERKQSLLSLLLTFGRR